MDEIVKEFLIESGENLDRLDQELVKLEADPNSKELLASIFRTIHTIKGSCGFLGFSRLEKVAHAGESLLSRLRDGKLSLTAQLTSGLLAMVDAVRRMLSEIQATGKDGENDYSELREELKRLQSGEGEEPGPATSPAEPVAPAPVVPIADAGSRTAAPAQGKSNASVATERPRILEGEPVAPSPASKPGPAPASVAPAGSQHQPVAGKIGALLIERGNIRPEELALALQDQEHGDQRRLGEILVSMGVCSQNDVLAAQQIIETRGRDAGVETVRVGINLLDKLMNLVGELVLTRNQLLQFANSAQDTGFQAISQRMNLIASELQEEVMKTRMQPIGNIWNKFPRTVRDLALGCGKEVRIEMIGKETELDRTIIEAIKDPLTHLVRNSVDHGIEPPEGRVRAGKPVCGCLTLRAFHEGGQVNIEISDDGAGLSRDRIRAKAVERGLVSSEQATRMADRDIFNMIFLPGFSTAEKVTNVSGRGVGMDVVRTNVEKIGGTVDVQSKAGQGTSVRVKIPLTLAIIPALLARCGGERFAIPQVSLTELVRLEAGKGIETMHGAPVYRLRGRLLPLVYLSQILEAQARTEAGSQRAGHNRGLMDFSGEREKHLQWLSRLQDMLAGKGSIAVDQAGSCHDCALGKWLYGEGLKEYGDMAEMRQLEETHKHFHERIRDIVVAKVSGLDAQAREGFSRAEPIARKIVELLTEVENKRALELQNVNVVVLQAENRQFGLVVDDILDTQEIVVKPLGRQLKGLSVYSGATIMGDGRVALILDVMGLAQKANVIARVDETALSEKAEQQGAGRAATGTQTLLLVQAGRDGRAAMPLSAVARLEEFPASAIEHAGTQEVLQYRGQIIPAIRLSQFLGNHDGEPSAADGALVQVVVYSEGGRSVGLIVDRIADIVEATVAAESLDTRTGVLGSVVIQKRVTELLDVAAIVRSSHPGFFEEQAAGVEQ